MHFIGSRGIGYLTQKSLGSPDTLRVVDVSQKYLPGAESLSISHEKVESTESEICAVLAEFIGGLHSEVCASFNLLFHLT